MIRVEVRLYATLGAYLPDRKPGEAVTCELADGATVGSLLADTLRIPAGTVKTVFVNGVSRGMDHVLAAGDRVGVFPPIAGG